MCEWGTFRHHSGYRWLSTCLALPEQRRDRREEGSLHHFCLHPRYSEATEAGTDAVGAVRTGGEQARLALSLAWGLPGHVPHFFISKESEKTVSLPMGSGGLGLGALGQRIWGWLPSHPYLLPTQDFGAQKCVVGVKAPRPSQQGSGGGLDL